MRVALIDDVAAHLRRYAWVVKYVLLVGAAVGAWLLRGLADPSMPGSVPGIVELQLAGTRETAISLLRVADRRRLTDSIPWDAALILVYGVGLYVGLRMFSASVREQPTLLDRFTPQATVFAVGCDMLQDTLLLWELRAPLARPPGWLDWVPGVTATLTLVNWTLLLAATGHLAWLVWLDASGRDKIVDQRRGVAEAANDEVSDF